MPYVGEGRVESAHTQRIVAGTFRSLDDGKTPMPRLAERTGGQSAGRVVIRIEALTLEARDAPVQQHEIRLQPRDAISVGRGQSGTHHEQPVAAAVGEEFGSGQRLPPFVVDAEAEIDHHVALVGMQGDEDGVQDRRIERSGDHGDEDPDHFRVALLQGTRGVRRAVLQLLDGLGHPPDRVRGNRAFPRYDARCGANTDTSQFRYVLYGRHAAILAEPPAIQHEYSDFIGTCESQV